MKHVTEFKLAAAMPTDARIAQTSSFHRPRSGRTMLWGMILVGLSLAPAPLRAAVISWNGSSGDMTWSSVLNWAPESVPGPTDYVRFLNDGSAPGPIASGGAINNLVDAAFPNSIRSLSYRNIVGYHNTSLINPLLVLGESGSDVDFVSDDGHPVIFLTGSGVADGANDIVHASVTGGTLVVSNSNASLSVMQASTVSGGHRATLDLTGLASFTCVVSNVLIGHDFGVPVTRPTGTLILGHDNFITARLISIGEAYQNAGAISHLRLGQANVLQVDRIRVALHKCLGGLSFAPGLNAPSATFRGTGGDGRQRSWEIGDEYEPDQSIGYFTSSQSTGTMDLTGGTVDALVDRITLGRGQTNAPTRTGDGNGTLSFDQGSINANHLELGIQLSDGGSVGRGTLNLNRKEGAERPVMTVNGDVVMAMQYPGNTDPSGATGTINLNGGILAVGGSVREGAGLSTITIDQGGTLDLMPAGDATPGDVSVDVLNLNDGALVNYSILSVSNVVLGPSITQFTLHPGQTLSPLGSGQIGDLTLNGDLNAGGTLDLEVRKLDGVLSADRIVVGGLADLEGIIRVQLSGNGSLAIGDKFTLIAAQFFRDSSPIVALPPLDPGLSWANNLATAGTIEVIASEEPATPPTLTLASTASGLTISWPTAYTSFVLRGQTNALATGLTTNWARVLGTVGNQLTIPFHRDNPSVFFQLIREP